MLTLDSHSTFCFNLFPKRHFWTAQAVQRSKGGPALRDRSYTTARGPRLPKLRPNPASLHRPSSPLRGRPPHPTATQRLYADAERSPPPKMATPPTHPQNGDAPLSLRSDRWRPAPRPRDTAHPSQPRGAARRGTRRAGRARRRDRSPPTPRGEAERRNGQPRSPGAQLRSRGHGPCLPPTPGDRGDGATHAPGVVVVGEGAVGPQRGGGAVLRLLGEIGTKTFFSRLTHYLS